MAARPPPLPTRFTRTRELQSVSRRDYVQRPARARAVRKAGARARGGGAAVPVCAWQVRAFSISLPSPPISFESFVWLTSCAVGLDRRSCRLRVWARRWGIRTEGGRVAVAALSIRGIWSLWIGHGSWQSRIGRTGHDTFFKLISGVIPSHRWSSTFVSLDCIPLKSIPGLDTVLL